MPSPPPHTVVTTNTPTQHAISTAAYRRYHQHIYTAYHLHCRVPPLPPTHQHNMPSPLPHNVVTTNTSTRHTIDIANPGRGRARGACEARNGHRVCVRQDPVNDGEWPCAMHVFSNAQNAYHAVACPRYCFRFTSLTLKLYRNHTDISIKIFVCYAGVYKICHACTQGRICSIEAVALLLKEVCIRTPEPSRLSSNVSVVQPHGMAQSFWQNFCVQNYGDFDQLNSRIG